MASILSPKQVHDAIKFALLEQGDGMAWRPSNTKATNSLRSSRFCSGFADALSENARELLGSDAATCRHITVLGDGTRESGEWLLDAAWTRDIEPSRINALPSGKIMDASKLKIPAQLICAMESESDSSAESFFTDFAKLLNIHSPIKIFLAGINHLSAEGMDSYIKLRLKQTRDVIQSYEQRNDVQWLLGFWPTPAKPTGQEAESLWDLLTCDPPHHAKHHLLGLPVYQYSPQGWQLGAGREPLMPV